MRAYVRLRRAELTREVEREETQCKHEAIGLEVPGLSFGDGEGGHFRLFCVMCGETLAEAVQYE